MPFPGWNNSKGLDYAKRVCADGDVAVQTYGDQIWAAMTDLSHVGFTLDTISQCLGEEHPGLPLSTRRKYVRAFFAYCFAANEDFGGPESRLVKRGHRFIMLDNPER